MIIFIQGQVNDLGNKNITANAVIFDLLKVQLLSCCRTFWNDTDIVITELPDFK